MEGLQAAAAGHTTRLKGALRTRWRCPGPASTCPLYTSATLFLLPAPVPVPAPALSSISCSGLQIIEQTEETLKAVSPQDPHPGQERACSLLQQVIQQRVGGWVGGGYRGCLLPPNQLLLLTMPTACPPGIPWLPQHSGTQDDAHPPSQLTTTTAELIPALGPRAPLMPLPLCSAMPPSARVMPGSRRGASPPQTAATAQTKTLTMQRQQAWSGDG